MDGLEETWEEGCVLMLLSFCPPRGGCGRGCLVVVLGCAPLLFLPVSYLSSPLLSSSCSSSDHSS